MIPVAMELASSSIDRWPAATSIKPEIKVRREAGNATFAPEPSGECRREVASARFSTCVSVSRNARQVTVE